MPARVSLAKCRDYSDPARLEAAIDTLLSGLGDTKELVGRGCSVFLKPNLLTDDEPERAVTTHPEVIRALIRWVRKRGGIPSVGDSPANVTKTDSVWERTGMLAVCQEESVPLVNLEKAGSQRFEVGEVSFSVARPVLETDVLISVPKVKTHMLTVFTGAVKNLYGTIPGFQKSLIHKQYPRPRAFSEVLVSLYAKVKPHISIADGIVGMEGEGPSGGEPIDLGFLGASRDGVALDAVLCSLLGIKQSDVPYFAGLEKAHLGETRLDNIEVVGSTIAELTPDKFKAPSPLLGQLIPGPLIRLLKPILWIRPMFDEHCVSCGRCVKACPAEALTLEKGGRPKLAHGKCIECCCCHEVCPEDAVTMTQSPLWRRIRRGKFP